MFLKSMTAGKKKKIGLTFHFQTQKQFYFTTDIKNNIIMKVFSFFKTPIMFKEYQKIIKRP